MQLLGQRLTRDGIQYTLELQQGRWFLYRGKRVVRELYQLLIIKADRHQNGSVEYCFPESAIEGQTVLTVKCGHRNVLRNKLTDLASGKIKKLSHRLLKPREEPGRSDEELIAIGRLSLDQLFGVMNGEVRLCDLTGVPSRPEQVRDRND
jgi:hypothetical protein